MTPAWYTVAGPLDTVVCAQAMILMLVWLAMLSASNVSSRTTDWHCPGTKLMS